MGIKGDEGLVPTILFISIYILKWLSMTRKMDINNISFFGFFCEIIQLFNNVFIRSIGVLKFSYGKAI